jgi:hypothetical protein
MQAVTAEQTSTIAPPTAAQLLEYRVWMYEMYKDYIDDEIGMARDTLCGHVVAHYTQNTQAIKAKIIATNPGWRFNQMWNLSASNYEADF